MNDLDPNLKRFFDYLGRGLPIKYEITSNGNCFFHALEYALGNCQINDTENVLFNDDRTLTGNTLIDMYQAELVRLNLLDETNRISNEEIARRKTLREKIKRLNKFIDTSGRLVYSEEDEICLNAFFKKKILFIIDCTNIPGYLGEYGFTLVKPDGIDLIEDNIVIMTRTARQHYDTLDYGQVNGRDNGRIFPANFVELLNTGILELQPQNQLPQVTMWMGHLNIFFGGPTGIEAPAEYRRSAASNRRQNKSASNWRSAASNWRSTASNRRSAASNWRSTASNRRSAASNWRSTASNRRSAASNRRSAASNRSKKQQSLSIPFSLKNGPRPPRTSSRLRPRTRRGYFKI